MLRRAASRICVSTRYAALHRLVHGKPGCWSTCCICQQWRAHNIVTLFVDLSCGHYLCSGWGISVPMQEEQSAVPIGCVGDWMSLRPLMPHRDLSRPRAKVLHMVMMWVRPWTFESASRECLILPDSVNAAVVISQKSLLVQTYVHPHPLRRDWEGTIDPPLPLLGHIQRLLI